MQKDSELLLAVVCANCTLCDGAAYQTFPLLGFGNPAAPIIVIAQNPGEIKIQDVSKVVSAKAVAETIYRGRDNAGKNVLAWYKWDFTGTIADKSLGRILGQDWANSNLFYFTNAVRCRTKNNEAPSVEMVENCRRFTKKLVAGREGIIFVGRLAVAQLLGKEGARNLPAGSLKKHPEYGLLLAIPHWAAWRGNDQTKLLKRKVEIMKKQLFWGDLKTTTENRK